MSGVPWSKRARRTLRIFPLYYLVLVVLLIVLPRLLSRPETLLLGTPWLCGFA